MKMRPNAMASTWPSAIAGLCALAGEAAGRDQDAFPDRAEQHHRRRHVLVIDLGAAGAARARLDEMQIGKPQRIERLDRIRIERHRLDLAGAVGDAIGRQPHADPVRAHTSTTASVTSIRKRTRFSIEPPYWSVR